VVDEPTQTQISRLRWLTVVAGIALFVTDYGFDLFKKEVPNYVYAALAAIALGVDVTQLRELLLRVLTGGKAR
jgi:hypothetical protein